MQPNTKGLLHHVHQLLLEGQYEAALEILTPICKADPDNANAWWLVANALQDPERRKRALNKVLALKPNHVMAKALLNELTPPTTKTAKQSSSIQHQPIRRKTTPKPKRGFLERFLNRIVHSMVGLLITIGILGVIVFLREFDGNIAQISLPPIPNTLAVNSQAHSSASSTPLPSIAPDHTLTTADELPPTWTPSPVPAVEGLPTSIPWWESSATPFANTITNSDMPSETAQVIQVIDGDTIEVRLNNESVRVRYLGVNTPERDEPCYSTAANANSALVGGQTVRLVRDISDSDQYGRLLRYVYVGDTFVNQALVRQGVAEAVYYSPDGLFFSDFSVLEDQAANAEIGCHPTGIFDDNSDTR